MATDTPSKQDRVERHLQRQRGAGVRNLATSFGFYVFGAPIVHESLDQLTTSHEPPAKRRKTSKQHTINDEAVVSPGDNLELGQNTSKPRRRFESTEPVLRSKAHEEDDSFVHTKPKATVTRKGRDRKVARNEFQPTEDVLNNGGAANAQLTAQAKKRGRPKKADIVDATAAELPVKKRGRPKKVPDQTPAQHDDSDLMNAGHQPMPEKEPTKKRGRPKKILGDEMEQEGGSDAMEAVATLTSVPARHREVREDTQGDKRPAAKKRKKVPNVDEVSAMSDNNLSDPTRRPRRLAAAAALTRVTEGFIEEELPIEKKRRDPEPERPQRKKRTKDHPDSVPKGSEHVAATSHGLDAKTALDDNAERPIPPPTTANSDARQDVEIIASKSEGHVVSTRAPLAETTVNATMQSVSPDKPVGTGKGAGQQITSKPPALSRAPKLDRKKVKVSQKGTVIFVNPDRTNESMERPQLDETKAKAWADEGSKSRTVNPPTGSSDLAGSLFGVSMPAPTKSDRHPRNNATTAADEPRKVASPRATGEQPKPSKPKPDKPVKNRRERVATEHQSGLGGATEVSPQRKQCKAQKSTVVGNPANQGTVKAGEAPAKPAKSSTQTAEQDIDWLFDRKEGGQAFRSVHRAPPKKRRDFNKHLQSPDMDMDLDDLLSNIATYAANQITRQEQSRPATSRRI